MRMLVVSHTPHYRRDGEVVGWGGTVREIDALAEEFGDVRHMAVLHRGPAPRSAISYSSGGVRLVPIPPAGGPRLLDKIGILLRAPGYLATLVRELRKADLVHVRCPAHIAFLALVLLTISRRPAPRWVKYAGNWQSYPGEPRSYALQRWWLKKGLHRGVTTVNGRWAGDPEHVHAFINPCLTEEELQEGRAAADTKILTSPLRLLFVGRLDERKGAPATVEVLERLVAAGVDAELDMVGDGPARAALEARNRSAPLSQRIRIHGGLPREALNPLYAAGHFIVLPSRSEGWPKVLSEAMAYGVVPIAASRGSVPQYLSAFGCGRAVDGTGAESYSAVIMDYLAAPAMWNRECRRGVGAARLFGYQSYRVAVRRLLGMATSGAAGLPQTPDGMSDLVSPLWR